MSKKSAANASERPGLAAWRARHELRRSNAAQPIPSRKGYDRSAKHTRARQQRDGY